MAFLVITTAEAQVFSLKEAWQYALEHNPSMTSVSYDATIAEKNLDLATSSYYPQIQLITDYRKIDSDRAGFYQGMMPENKSSLTAKITQDIFNLETNTQIEKAKISQTLAKLHKDSTQMDLAFAIGTVVVDIAYNQIALNIYQEKEKRISGYLKTTNDKYIVGTIDLSDVYRWESELAKIHSMLQEIKNTIFNYNSLLKKHLGIPQFETIDIIFKQEDIEAFANIYDDISVINPKVETLKENIKSYSVEVENIDRSYYIPKITLYGDREETLHKDGKGDILPSSQNNNNYTFGIEMTLPLYEGGARKAKKEALQVKKLQTQSDVQSLENELLKEQENAKESIKNYQKSFELEKNASEKANKYLYTKHQQYKEGSLEITSLLDAEEYASLSALSAEQKRYLVMKYKLTLSYALSKLQKPFNNF